MQRFQRVVDVFNDGTQEVAEERADVDLHVSEFDIGCRRQFAEVIYGPVEIEVSLHLRQRGVAANTDDQLPVNDGHFVIVDSAFENISGK